MTNTLKPFIGQKVTFHPPGGGAPIASVVNKVWSDTCVNLECADGTVPTSVFYAATDAATNPAGYFCMPEPVEHFIQPKITGYRQLTPEETALINEGKALAEQVGAYIAKLRLYTGPKTSADDQARLALDQRWISIGATELQQGFMAVIRGIAQPTTF